MIITNGIHTYYIYTYTCGEINWSTIGGESAVVGHNAHKKKFSNHPSSGYSSIGEAVSCTFATAEESPQMTVTSSGEVEVDPATEQAILECSLYEQTVKNEITPAVLETEILPNVLVCPPTVKQADLDENFHGDPNNANCRLQASPFEYKQYSIVQQCCYDASG